MAQNRIDVTELAAFGERLARAARQMPEEAGVFLRKEGTKLAGRTRAQARRTVKPHKKPRKFRHSKHFVQTIKRGRVYFYGSRAVQAVRVYSAAPHAHLIEYGHAVKHRRGGPVDGRARPHPVFAPAGDAFAPVFAADAARWLADTLGGTLEGGAP